MGSSQIPQAAQAAYTLTIDPHVQSAIWAIFMAVALALALVLAEMLEKLK
jgi:hypothetical protein